MENISVYDNFLNEDELKSSINIITRNKWTWVHELPSESMLETPFWRMDLMNEDYFSIYFKYIIEKKLSKKCHLLKIYAIGQTLGQDEIYNQGCRDESYTFCLYLHDVNNKYIDSAGGYIFFKIPDNKFDICYEPLSNRGIFFPSNYIHKSNAFYRHVTSMRICVYWKFKFI